MDNKKDHEYPKNRKKRKGLLIGPLDDLLFSRQYLEQGVKFFSCFHNGLKYRGEFY